MRHVLQLKDDLVLDVEEDEEGCYTVVDGPCPQCTAPLRVVGRGSVTAIGTSLETVRGSEFKAHCRACGHLVGILHSVDEGAGAA